MSTISKQLTYTQSDLQCTTPVCLSVCCVHFDGVHHQCGLGAGAVAVAAVVTVVCCWLLACLLSRNRPAKTSACAATLRHKLHIKLSISSSHRTDTAPTSPSTDPVRPGNRQGSHYSTMTEGNGMTQPLQHHDWRYDSATTAP